ncbi:MAG TPA: hypothetical protein VFX56_09045 [Nitrospira sp.]|nr:hypothetical protein [Nitrospira sp.]
MPLIWAAISAHGFGHAAQVVPVLNALGRRIPGLRTILRTTVPASFFQNRLAIPWELSPTRQDIGCVQQGPLTIDVEATWQEHARFHATWDDRVQAEVDAMHRARPNVILADTPYLAITAGATAGLPTVGLVSFTWDLVLSGLPAPPSIDGQTLIRAMRHAYGQADLALRITPSPNMGVFKRLVDIGPISEPAPSAHEALSALLPLSPGERTVLIGFGGIPLGSLPMTNLEELKGYRFLFDGPVPPNSTRFVSTQSFPFSFKTVLASVDIIMSKPGYGTLVEAVALRTPLVYVRRYNFADEQPLVDYLHRYGRGVELGGADFSAGRWEPALRAVGDLPTPSVPPPTASGAEDAADVLATYL